MNDPIAMYLSDVYTVSTNLLGLPAMSIPMGFKEEMPLGLQIIGKHFDEKNILKISHLYQQETDWHKRSQEFRYVGNCNWLRNTCSVVN